MKKLTFLLPLVFVLSVLQQSNVAEACSCAPPNSVDVSLPKAYAVFVGKVEKSTQVPMGVGEQLVKFSLERPFKGPADAQITVKTSVSSASCGYPFEVGERYLVYSYNEGLDVSLCSRTKKAEEATSEITRLAELTANTAPATAAPGQRGCGCQSSQNGGGTILLLFGLTLLCLRRRSW